MSDYNAVRREIVRRMRGRVIFFIHAAIYALCFVVTIAMPPWLRNGAEVAFLTWGSILVFHAARHFRWWDKWIDRMTQRELAHHDPTYSAIADKPKRDVRLSDDGELEYIEEEITPQRKVRK
ncbi:MAG: hypothetical protein OHK0023_12080 [Anaerolineae bacterium]